MLHGSRAGREFWPKSSQLPLKALQREALGKERDQRGWRRRRAGRPGRGFQGTEAPKLERGCWEGKGATLGTETTPGGGWMS